MKKIEDLTTADFSGIKEEYFEEWKVAEINLLKFGLPVFGVAFFLILLAAFKVVTGFLIVAVYCTLMIISLVFSIKVIRLRKLVGISKKELDKVRKE